MLLRRQHKDAFWLSYLYIFVDLNINIVHAIIITFYFSTGHFYKSF